MLCSLFIFLIPISLYGTSFLSVLSRQSSEFGGVQPTLFHLAGALWPVFPVPGYRLPVGTNTYGPMSHGTWIFGADGHV